MHKPPSQGTRGQPETGKHLHSYAQSSTRQSTLHARLGLCTGTPIHCCARGNTKRRYGWSRRTAPQHATGHLRGCWRCIKYYYWDGLEAPWAWALVPVSLVMSRTVHGTGSRTRYKVYGPGTGNWCASRYIIT